MGDDLLGHFKVKTAVNCNLAPYRFIIWLMLFTHTVAYKIKEVQVNIPFSFLNILCCLVLFFCWFSGSDCR